MLYTFCHSVNKYFAIMTKRPPPAAWAPQLDPEIPRYQAIVEALKRDIGSGDLEPGTRLPTQRELAVSLSVALGTVTRAYAEAERRGLVRMRGARGTFVGPLEIPDPESAVIEMGVDLPIHCEDPALSPTLHDLAKRADLNGLLRYHPVGGISRHREAGVEWTKRFGIETSPDRIVVCAGTQHALTVSLMSMAEPNDLILTDELTYAGMRSVANHLHLRLAGVKMDRRGMLPSEVESICRKQRVRALYCIPSFHNPTTRQLSLRRRQAIASLAMKYDFAILEDDVHRLVSDTPPPPIGVFAPDQTYYIASFSKAVTAGLRVAFLVPPGSECEAISQAVWASIWMVPPLTAEIAATWIFDGTADDVLRRKRREAQQRQTVCRRILANSEYEFQSSGYYIWLHLPAPWTSAEFALEARKRGVAVTPAQPFLVDQTPAPAAVRICLAAPESRSSMERGLTILASLLAKEPGKGQLLV